MVPWRSALHRFVEKQKPGTILELEKGFSWIPVDIRIGPWAWGPTLVYGAILGGLALTLPQALASFDPLPDSRDLRAPRFGCFLFGIGILAVMVKHAGCGPFASWTILGWTAATLRYLAGALELRTLHRALMFPPIMANTVTVVLWYLAVLPGITYYAEKGKRWETWSGWVFKPFLMTVHGLNLPFALLDFYMQPMVLNTFDVWAGMTYGIAYLTFYLSILDPLGIHFYFILSPRKWWGAVVYLGILAFGFVIRWATNAWGAWLQQS